MAKRIMQEFALDEISAVTKPAQKGARMVIMKREGAVDDGPPKASKRAEEVAAALAKGKYKLTTSVNGHSHLIEVDDFAMLRGGGRTEWMGEYDQPNRHSHPFVIGPKGEITIGEANGHTHEIADVPTMKAAELPPPAKKNATESTQKGDAMTPEEKAKFEEFQALASMNDAQKAHLAKLADAERAAFIAASPAEREATVAKALAAASESDPVVYKGGDGVEYRKSDGDKTIALAKRLDGMVNAFEQVQKSSADVEAKALAEKWVHIGKTLDEKIEMAKGIIALPEPARKAALAAIDAGAEQARVLFKNIGHLGGGNPGVSGDAVSKLQKMAEDHAKATSQSFHKAYDQIIVTPEGARLYEETLAATRH